MKNKVLLAMMVFALMMAGCDDGGGGGGEVGDALTVYPTGTRLRMQGRLWATAGMTDGTDNYLVDDDGLLALGPEKDGDGSSWEVYVEDLTGFNFVPGTKQKIALRNVTTGRFVNREGVSRTPRETTGVQLKVSNWKNIDEFYWYITKSELGTEGFNFANYGFQPATGGIWSFAGNGNYGVASGNTATYKAVFWTHADHVESTGAHETDWDTWDGAENFKGVIEGRAFNLFFK
jgi:hypothetical protein